ncbi:MAG: hypothetical protein A3C84_00560 [Candidatus Ryanbacteria bacterium RIFCSPHIGHO2_02_FULL_48_12]|uniref:Uncharacterized protein n=1 Tax=Candidatus Ryanbacteria bacterium RIFCSPHIGHO2_01_FULL_48_27 TaxID=1802115 RepID=A0A1G2FZW2_9BACT|nr:MAG: hypothetical protein A2756_04940 [Candidatus Ryanbacteria bacterium RIFCSPHIGHO2_01_FULL_48_27]OGZ50265.1 MAG: hypothetical protein A3C84_00560 [Candidatus Ryanbacteria bacterium RIFCSPHIGHO2_02_FULL_48_12]
MTPCRKLVRDRIPEIIAVAGDACKTRILDDVEYRAELLKKLTEEAAEVLRTNGDKDELIKELADVLEVLEYIILAHGVRRDDIERVHMERKASRGGFEKKIFLEYTE